MSPQKRLNRLMELNETRLDGGLCETHAKEFLAHRRVISRQCLDMVKILADTGALSLLLPGETEADDLIRINITDAYECGDPECGGIHLAADDLDEDDEEIEEVELRS
jgi:hypothetical protein